MHTELPWETHDKPCIDPKTGEGEIFSGGDWSIYPPLGEAGPIAIVGSKDDVQFIVRAVNNHYQLLEALANTLELVRLKYGNRHEDVNQIIEMAEQAIAIAKE